MSLSDSELSSPGEREYKFFRNVSRDRLLYEMLGSAKGENSKSSWKVLIMDKVTVKVMAASCKMADITDQEISLVEDLFRRRQPMPTMDSIYFIQPSKENIVMFLSDMSGREPLYRKAYVFFSSPVPKELINHIKNDTSVLPRIGALREMNLEFFPIENQAFVTEQETALGELYGNIENTRRFNACLNVMATRLATVLASLKEFPFVRYRAPKESDSAEITCDQVPQMLANAVWQCILKYKSTIPKFPQTETCELLIVDRSIDLIAPIIHEWTYDAMCHDLLELDGNKYTHEAPGKAGGEPVKKEVVLEDHDTVWVEIRDLHIAEASERLHDKMTTFKSKNKAAQFQNARKNGEVSTRDLQKMVQALPQYNETVEKLSLHVEIAGKINGIIRDDGLRDLGQLEQDLVFGDAGAKEVISFLRANQDTSPENKLRLMLIYAFVYPEKFEGDKATKLMQLAKLSAEDMKVVKNMQLLAGYNKSDTNKKKSGFSLKFDNQKTKHAARKDKTEEEEEAWALSRFYPVIEELIQSINNGDLQKNEYLCLNNQKSDGRGSANRFSARTGQAPTAPPETKRPAQSRRSRRTANWGRSRVSDDGSSTDSALNQAVDYKRMGQRIFVFVIGGATRSELRVCHKLTTKLRREVVLGTSSVDDPAQYLKKLKMLTEKGCLA